MRINPATRHSETKYGFVVLTGEMIFKHFFVGVKLLLRHEHLSSAAANSHQNQLTCHQRQSCERLTCSPFDRRRLSLSTTSLEHTAKGTHRQRGDGCQSPRCAYARKTPLPNWCKRRPSNGLRFGWGCATVSLSTKKIKGLHENDFIMASKIDRLLDRTDGFLDHKQ